MSFSFQLIPMWPIWLNHFRCCVARSCDAIRTERADDKKWYWRCDWCRNRTTQVLLKFGLILPRAQSFNWWHNQPQLQPRWATIKLNWTKPTRIKPDGEPRMSPQITPKIVKLWKPFSGDISRYATLCNFKSHFGLKFNWILLERILSMLWPLLIMITQLFLWECLNLNSLEPGHFHSLYTFNVVIKNISRCNWAEFFWCL